MINMDYDGITLKIGVCVRVCVCVNVYACARAHAAHARVCHKYVLLSLFASVPY